MDACACLRVCSAVCLHPSRVGSDTLTKQGVEYEQRSHGKEVLRAPDVGSHTVNQASAGAPFSRSHTPFVFVILFIVLASVLSQRESLSDWRRKTIQTIDMSAYQLLATVSLRLPQPRIGPWTKCKTDTQAGSRHLDAEASL